MVCVFLVFVPLCLPLFCSWLSLCLFLFASLLFICLSVCLSIHLFPFGLFSVQKFCLSSTSSFPSSPSSLPSLSKEDSKLLSLSLLLLLLLLFFQSPNVSNLGGKLKITNFGAKQSSKKINWKNDFFAKCWNWKNNWKKLSWVELREIEREK